MQPDNAAIDHGPRCGCVKCPPCDAARWCGRCGAAVTPKIGSAGTPQCPECAYPLSAANVGGPMPTAGGDSASRDRLYQQQEVEAMNQTYINGQWADAVPMRRATWLEVLLDRYIGPRTGHPWRSVLKGILGRA